MVGEILVQSMLSAIAGLVVAVTTAFLTEYREKQRWLRTKVHQPLYGELTAAISGALPEAADGYGSLWADLDYYKTYRVDPSLAELLDTYSSELSELSATERDETVQAFVDALPEYMCGAEEHVVELPSGRRIDMRTWFRRNMLVLSTALADRDGTFGVDPESLEYLWAEVDGIEVGDDSTEPFDTAAALGQVSTEFNWGYEACYERWPDGWLDDLAAAFAAADSAGDGADSRVQETVRRRREIGRTASELKGMIARRADRGLFANLLRSAVLAVR